MGMHETVSPVNTLSPRQNGRRFAGDLFKYIFLNENVWILIKISLKFVPKDPINNIPALVRVMAWRRPGAKPLSEPVMVNDEWWLPTHIKRHSASMTIGPWEIRQYTKVLWRHQMDTFSPLLGLCAGNSPITSEFPAQRPVTRSFGVFFDLRLNKRLSEQLWSWWFETSSRPLRRHCNGECDRTH